MSGTKTSWGTKSASAVPPSKGRHGPCRLGARPSNSQQAEVLEFYCRMAHLAGVIQQLCPVGCIILSLSELLGRAPSTESSTPPCNKGLRNARSDESADRFDFCDDH